MSTRATTHTSAGGLVFRRAGERVEVALVSVGEKARWQLPKGIVEPNESPAVAALREVKEEAGIVADIVAPLETIEYWYVSWRAARKRASTSSSTSS